MEAAVQRPVHAGRGPARPLGEGHGRRLTHALEALDVYPALAESRDRLLRLVGEEQPSTSDMVVAGAPSPSSRSRSCAWRTGAPIRAAARSSASATRWS